MAIDISAGSMSIDQMSNLVGLAYGRGWSIGHGYEVLGVDSSRQLSGFLHLDRRVDIGMNKCYFYY